MFKQGDVIEIKEDAPYAVTRPGTKWLVYASLDNGLLRVGPQSKGGFSNKQMIETYLSESIKSKMKRFEDNVKIYSVSSEHCRPAGNNALFKNVLSQGDPWEEEKKLKTSSRGKGYYTDGIDW
jgi:hypothetical protein